jgi:hypothetical protein
MRYFAVPTHSGGTYALNNYNCNCRRVDILARPPTAEPLTHRSGGTHPVVGVEVGGREDVRVEARVVPGRLRAVVDGRGVAVVVGGFGGDG